MKIVAAVKGGWAWARRVWAICSDDSLSVMVALDHFRCYNNMRVRGSMSP